MLLVKLPPFGLHIPDCSHSKLNELDEVLLDVLCVIQLIIKVFNATLYVG
ncbi:MAG TPA: hypothetical protein VH234_00900 [Candidatus Saccharimonadales bacterium]|nr:hypothetical protein [Candidatus Saccharimonadales bacterium]